MQFVRHGIVNPDDLALLRRALDRHCAAAGVGDSPERDDFARLLIIMFDAGIRDEEALVQGLARAASVPKRS